jgi:predicted transposase YdaD
MNLPDFFKDYGDKPLTEVKEEIMKLYATMLPEKFFEYINNMLRTATENGREIEREEIVCRFLADGMTVEEIALILCVKTEKIRIIESNNAAIKIPEYAKNLNLRRKRRERNTNK